VSKPLRWKHIFTITLPEFGQDIMNAPAKHIVQMIYANHLGVPLEMIALINLISVLFDAVTDPVMGVISDRYYRRRHTRKPFLLVGTVISLFGMWFLYNPGDDASAYRFLIFYLIYYTGWTVLEIPYTAWKAEVTEDYQSRTRIAGTDVVMATLGISIFGLIPVLLGNGEYTLETLQIASWVVLAILPPLVVIAVTMTPDGPVPVENGPPPSLRENAAELLGNKPFLHYLAILALTMLVFMMSQAASMFYATNYLGVGEALPLITLCIPVTAVVVAPVWTMIAGKIDKHRAWAIGVFAIAVFPAIADSIMSPEFAPVALMVAFAILTSAGFGGVNIAYKAMLGDILDYGKLKYGTDNGGIYVAITKLTGKVMTAIAMSGSLIIAGAFGFESGATNLDNSAATGLRVVYAWIPLAIGILALPVILRYPLSKRRHAIVVKALERKRCRAAAV
jgi:GPH family glycoside/pentoside/hexuronide:cation symporter